MKHIIFEDTIYSLEKIRKVQLDLDYSSIALMYEDGTILHINFTNKSEEFIRFYFNRISEKLLTNS